MFSIHLLYALMSPTTEDSNSISVRILLLLFEVSEILFVNWFFILFLSMLKFFLLNSLKLSITSRNLLSVVSWIFSVRIINELDSSLFVFSYGVVVIFLVLADFKCLNWLQDFGRVFIFFFLVLPVGIVLLFSSCNYSSCWETCTSLFSSARSSPSWFSRSFRFWPFWMSWESTSWNIIIWKYFSS